VVGDAQDGGEARVVEGVLDVLAAFGEMRPAL
jgi:hypothetical protein